MALNFQKVREQVKELGESAFHRESQLKSLRELAQKLLGDYADQQDVLRQKVQDVVHRYDPSLRCGVPTGEVLNIRLAAPPPPERASLLAVDGSQIFLDRHAAAEYFLVNVGAIRMVHGDPGSPVVAVDTDLHFGDELHVSGEYPSEDKISLLRDLRERQKLVELAAGAQQPVVSLTDGPLELWGARQENGDPAFAEGLKTYLDSLAALESMNAVTAGYVDRPTEDYVVRLLEIAIQPPEEAKNRPLLGVRDWDLFSGLLAPGERSAVFEMQTRSAQTYSKRSKSLALHFFYLNVGREDHPWLARVDHTGWVAHDPNKLDTLHAILLHQCRILGAHPYPYVLHRAHETAVVSMDEKKQLDALILHELIQHGILGQASQKQSNKDLQGSRRYR